MCSDTTRSCNAAPRSGLAPCGSDDGAFALHSAAHSGDSYRSPIKAVLDVGVGDSSRSGRTTEAATATRVSAAPLSSDIPLLRRALDEAEVTFGHARSGDRLATLLAPMLHTTVCHNLATALRAAGHAAEARDFQSLMLSRLIEHASASDCPFALRINCVRHLKPAIALSWSACGSEADQCAVTVLAGRAQDVAAEVIRIAGYALGHQVPSGTPNAADVRTLQ